MAKKTQYFNVKKFVDSVIEEMRLGDTPPDIMERLREIIELRLSRRIMDTVIDNFSPEDMKVFQMILEDHRELDEIDVIMIIAQNKEGMKDLIVRNINSLFEELTYTAAKVDEAMKKQPRAA